MGIAIDEISEKYVLQLKKNKFLKTVGYKDAASAVRRAVKETAESAKKEIESATEPLKAKIAEQDVFISEQAAENQSLQERNKRLEQNLASARNSLTEKEAVVKHQEEEQNRLLENNKSLKQENSILDEGNAILRKSVSELQDRLGKWKDIVKEAYKQGITPEYREQKSGIANILLSLINHKADLKKAEETERLVKPEQIKTPEQKISLKKDVIVKADKKEVRPALPAKAIKQKSLRTVKQVSSDIIHQIESERVNQKLDRKRMDKASELIKILLGDAPQTTTYSSVQDQFKKTMDLYVSSARGIVNNRYKFEEDGYGKIRIGTDEKGRVILKERGIDFQDKFHPYGYEIFLQDGTSMEIYDSRANSYIAFRDTNDKELLKIMYSDHYSILISDKNGGLMVAEGIRDGVVKYLNVNFNEVKPVTAIENDELINDYAQNLIKKAKEGSISEQHSYRDTTDVDYFNTEGKRTVSEYYVNKKKNPVPVFTYLFNPENEQTEKLICSADFGIHGKIVDDGSGKPKIIQYRTKGITGIEKRRKGGKLNDFRMGFYKSTENEHFETQSLFDENYELDKDSWQRPVYEKRNYGIASHPLTKSFTFYDLSKHNIKPWDFSILKPYIK